MLGKLISYEFKASGRLIPLVYCIVGMLAVTAVALSFFKFVIIVPLVWMLLFLAGAAAMIITYVVIFMRFYRSMFSAEGYLSHTLPVSSTQLYISKGIVAICWLLLSLIVTFVSWVAAFASMASFIQEESGIDLSREVMDEISREMGDFFPMFFSTPAITFMIVITLIGYVSFIAQVFFCVTLSSVKPFSSLGIGGAILSYVGLSIISYILTSTLTYFLPLSVTFTPETGWFFTNQAMWNSMYDYSYNTSIGIGGYIMPILFAVGLPPLTIWLINNKVSLK